MNPAWIQAFMSALFGGALAAVGAWVAIRVSLARLEQRLEAHGERLGKVEAAVGMDGKNQASFITRDEAHVRILQGEERWAEVKARLSELREMLAEVKVSRVQ